LGWKSSAQETPDLKGLFIRMQAELEGWGSVRWVLLSYLFLGTFTLGFLHWPVVAAPTLMWWLFHVPRARTNCYWLTLTPSLRFTESDLVDQEREVLRVSLPGLDILPEQLGDIYSTSEGNIVLWVENCRRTINCQLMGPRFGFER